MDEKALNELHAEAVALEAAPQAEDVAAAAVAPAIDPAQEWAGILELGVTVLSPALPFLPSIYTPEARAQLAGALVPVAEKYGWNLGEIMGRWAPEIGLALVAGPLAIRTVQEFRALRAAQGAAERVAEESRIQRPEAPEATPA